MPCTVTETPQEMEASRQADALRRMTPLLCSACRALEQYGYDFALNPILDQFWAAHKLEDEARKAAEIKRVKEFELATALSKKKVGDLTGDERAILKKFGMI